jgi:atypical dual specificity phosphatase
MEGCATGTEGSERHDETSKREDVITVLNSSEEQKDSEATIENKAVSPVSQPHVLPTDDFARLGLSPTILNSSDNAPVLFDIDTVQQTPETQPSADDNLPHLGKSEGFLSSSISDDSDGQSCPPVISPSMPVLMHMDITHVCDGLYLSDFISLSATRLRELGITYVINATREIPFVDGADENVEFVKLFVDDVPTADIAQHFHICADKIRENHLKGNNSLIHCALGISRSVTICLAYLVKHEGRTLRQAYMEVKKKRPIIRPNDGFWRQLIAFETSVRGRATVKLNVYPMGVIPDVYRAAPRTGASRHYSVSDQ